MSAATGAAAGLELVGASAGSGKTHRVTEAVRRAVAPGTADAVAPEGLVAVTYTRRAAGELAARMRRSLVEAGAHDTALRLPLAYLGTVHAVCLRLLQEFAIDAGLSPQVDVLPGDESRWLREALEHGLDVELRSRLQSLADALELNWIPLTRRNDYLAPVQDIMTLARSNRIDGDALPEMGKRSAAKLLSLLGPAERDGDALDAALLAALEDVDRQLARIDDGVGKTVKARTTVNETLRKARRGKLLWSDWVRLQHLDPARNVQPVVDPVVQVALRVDRHPRLHAEVREMTVGIYEAARRGLKAYEEWKRRRRVVDFVDMIDRALTLLGNEQVQQELHQRLQMLVVDEFQDTSPVQLELFVRLHNFTRRSVWVGDRKQCIFEFAGADPALMEAVASWVHNAGGETPPLERNWRSRPELVEACSDLFAAAFEPHGYKAKEVAVRPMRSTPRGLKPLPEFGLWWLAAGNQGEAAAAVAEGIRTLLEKPAATPVVDRASDKVRDLRAGDVAVLVYTNKEAAELATALAARGVRATVARTGLVATPEGTLVTAALGVLVDPRDQVARAILEVLTGFGGQGPDAWLETRIAAVDAAPVAKNEGAEPLPEPLACLEPLRRRLGAMAPTEVLDAVLGALDAPSLCARWPDPEQRLGNLDAIRALAASYEESCTYRREAATVAGLLRYFEEAAEERIVRNEEIASDDQHVGAGDRAVTITTYHRAKGLEWPVVILSSLDRAARNDAFSVSPESDRKQFDPADPLGGRWIRYWPWPFGQQQKVRLADAAAASSEGKDVTERERRERVRLLYVGFTRARDHLILAASTSSKGPRIKWLEELVDARGAQLLQLPVAPGKNEQSTVVIGGAKHLEVPARHWLLGTGSSPPARLPGSHSHAWFARAEHAPAARPAYWISPSSAATDWPDLPPLVVGAASSIGHRLPLGERSGIESNVLGNAVHAFLAADTPELRREQRLAIADRIRSVTRVGELLSAEAFLQAGDQLRAWVDARWSGARWHREYPVTEIIATAQGNRRVQGTIDLLVETDEGVVIIDHKTFLGPEVQWPVKAAEFAAQLAAYAHVLTAAGKRVIGTYVHFALGGGIVELRSSPSSPEHDRLQVAYR